MDLRRLADPFPAEDIALGVCGCGCQRPTTIATRNDTAAGMVKGTPRRFGHGHALRLQSRSANWKGGRYSEGRYVMVWAPDHPNAHTRGYVYEHVLVATLAMGRPMPKGAEVHHLNGDKTDNTHANLVVCPSRAYHMLLEARQRAKAACGNYDWRPCSVCKRHSHPSVLLRKAGGAYFHRQSGGACVL